MHSNVQRALPVAIAGAGLIGSWHARAAARAGAHVIAVIDPNLERARNLAGRFSGCVAVPSLEALDAAVAPRVIHVCTPASTHDELTRASLARGSHVLVEKPLAPTASSTAALFDLAAESRLLLCPVHQCVFQRGARHVFQRRAELGELVHVRGLACSAGATGRSAADADNIATGILPHHLSLLERFAPGVLGTLRWTTARPQPGELCVVGSSPALTANLVISMHGRPTANEMTFIGSHGAAHLDLFHGFSVFEGGPVSRTSKMLRPFDRAITQFFSAGSNLVRRTLARQPAYPGLWELIDGFYAAVAGTAPAPISAAEALAVAQSIDSICRSPSS